MSVEPGKWGVIYNPKAGTRKVQKRWKEIKEYMDSKGVNYDYVQSEGFGSVERLAKILANNGYRTIVIVGGDGALNDAINGIMLSDAEDKENIALGMIPNGIGNDFAKYWGLSTEYKPAVDCIINHRLKKIDVGLRRQGTPTPLFPQRSQHRPRRKDCENHRPDQTLLGGEIPVVRRRPLLADIRTQTIPDAPSYQ